MSKSFVWLIWFDLIYSLLVNAYGQNGMGSRAVDLYNEISPHMRNDIIDLCVLNACSHSGLVNEARTIFNAISTKTDKITTAMVRHFHLFIQWIDSRLCLDWLSKSNASIRWSRKSPSWFWTNSHSLCTHVSYVESFLLRIFFQSKICLVAIMSGARTQHNSELSEKFFLQMKKHFPHLKEDLVAASILLSNTYCSTDKSRRSESLKKEVRESSIRPRSWSITSAIRWDLSRNWFSDKRINTIRSSIRFKMDYSNTRQWRNNSISFVRT